MNDLAQKWDRKAESIEHSAKAANSACRKELKAQLFKQAAIWRQAAQELRDALSAQEVQSAKRERKASARQRQAEQASTADEQRSVAEDQGAAAGEGASVQGMQEGQPAHGRD